MAIQNLYTLNAVKCPSQTYGQVSNGRLNPMQGVSVERSAGCWWPNFASQLTGEPELTFTTTQLATLFGALASGFLGISGNIDLELRKIQSLGGRVATAGSNHIRLRGTAGMMFVDSLRATVGQPAEADCKLKFVYDGTNPILTPTGSVAVTAAAGASEQFTFGKVLINSTPIPSITEMSFDFNWTPIVERAGGDIMPSFLAIEEANPELTLRGVDADLLATYGIDPSAVTSAAIYFRKRAANGQFVADGTAEHLILTLSQGGLLRVDDVGFGGNDRAVPSLKLTVANASAATYLGAVLGANVAIS